MESTARKVKDLYGKDPTHILSKGEHASRKTDESNVNKTNRVTHIFASGQIKNTIQPNKTWKCAVPPKVYNENNDILKGKAAEYSNSGKKNFNKVVENNRVFYY